MGSLGSQIIKDSGSLSSAGIAASQFTEKKHISSNIVLTKLIASYLFKSGGTTSTHETCEFGVMAKPTALGVPVAGDTDEERFMIGKTHMMCASTMSLADSIIQTDELHFEVNLKVTIPVDWDLWGIVRNGIGLTNSFAYLMRLFWALI